VPSADDFRFEAHREDVWVGGGVIAFRVATYAYNGARSFEGARERGELERRPGGARFDVWDEADGREIILLLGSAVAVAGTGG
jgi:ferric-dicitrate binding protein FerR (iron transport regulator)